MSQYFEQWLLRNRAGSKHCSLRGRQLTLLLLHAQCRQVAGGCFGKFAHNIYSIRSCHRCNEAIPVPPRAGSCSINVSTSGIALKTEPARVQCESRTSHNRQTHATYDGTKCTCCLVGHCLCGYLHSCTKRIRTYSHAGCAMHLRKSHLAAAWTMYLSSILDCPTLFCPFQAPKTC